MSDSVPSIKQESSSSQAEIIEPSEDHLQTGSALQMAQLPDTTRVSVSQLQHPADNRITTMLEGDIGIEESTLRLTTPDPVEQLFSNDLCTVPEHSAIKTAPCAVAGPSTCEPTMEIPVSPPSLSKTKTHMIYSRIVETSKRKKSGIGNSRQQEIVTEENSGDTAKRKRRRTDVTDTCDVSDTISLIDCMKTILGVVPTESANNTQQVFLPQPSNPEESNDIIAKKDTDVSVNLSFTTDPSFKEEAGDLDLSAAINEAPNNSKGQTSDQEQCEDVANQRARTCETGSCEVAGNPTNAPLNVTVSETLTVTGGIITESWSENKWKPPLSYIHFKDKICKEARKAQTGPHVFITSNQSSDINIATFPISKTDKTKSAIDIEYDSLMKYMNPIPVINLFTTDEDPDRGSSIKDFENSCSAIQISRKLLQFVKENGLSAYSKLKQCLADTEQRLLVTLLEMAERNEDRSAIKWVLEQQHQQKPSQASQIEDFREDLISHYRDNEATISLSPLVEEYDVPLMDFYVRPPMTAFVKPHILSKTTEQRKHIKENDEAYHDKRNDNVDQKKKIASYKELFFQENSSTFTKIYLTAPAGMGKSSFSQHVTMCWCQSHKPVEQSADKYRINDLKTMKEFDLLFLLHLRECEGQCNLDDLVIGMCSNLSRRSRYNKEVLETVLHEKRCLIILDGLDEWSHPSSCCRKPCVPHNNHPNNCTVLTTTRHWKLATVGLSSAHIDRLVEIDEFDKNTSLILERNAIAILNERGPRYTQISMDDFHKTISSIQSDEIFNTPYIKLQLITLFYDGIPISKSRCEIYSSIIELTLMRGLKKENLPLIQTSQPDVKTVLPRCIKNNKLCKLYSNLISKIGQLAFFSLFNNKNESRLIFHQNIVLQYLTEFELEFCLKTGLLSQTKDSSLLTKICHKIFFQHKSVQEFFAGFHISAEWRNDITRATFLKVCQSLSEILDMSNVLIFVCGMSPDVFSALFCEIREVVEGDTITRSYRSTINDHKHIHMVMDSNVQTMVFYQEMQVSCFKENVNNGNEGIKITLQDLLLYGHNRDKPALTAMVTSNPQYLKSLYMDIDMFYTDNQMLPSKELMDSLYPNYSTVFEILTGSVNSLTTVCLKHMTMTCNMLCSLVKHFANMKMLNAIFMSNIGCSDWLNDLEERRTNVNVIPLLKLLNHSKLQQTSRKEIVHIKFDLSQARQLKQLHLAYIPLSQLVLPRTTELQQLHLEGVIISHLDLSQTSNLQKLHFGNMFLSELDLSLNSQIQNLST